jgi:hypothetical protein
MIARRDIRAFARGIFRPRFDDEGLYLGGRLWLLVAAPSLGKMVYRQVRGELGGSRVESAIVAARTTYNAIRTVIR